MLSTQRVYFGTHQQANVISNAGFIAMRDPYIADKLYNRNEKIKLMYREKQRTSGAKGYMT